MLGKGSGCTFLRGLKWSQENAALKRALLKLRTLNQMKDVSQKASFEKQIQKVEREKQYANKELYNSREETEQKYRMWVCGFSFFVLGVCVEFLAVQ